MNSRIIHTGDPVWRELAGNVFETTHSVEDSFNVYHDDSQTIQNVLESFLAGNATADVLVVHSLLVDHNAHKTDTSSPSHPAINAALRQFNQHMQYAVSHLPDNTLLFVFGDHGLSRKGNHGGATIDEVTTGLCVHSHSVPLPPFTVFVFLFVHGSVSHTSAI